MIANPNNQSSWEVPPRDVVRTFFVRADLEASVSFVFYPYRCSEYWRKFQELGGPSSLPADGREGGRELPEGCRKPVGCS